MAELDKKSTPSTTESVSFVSSWKETESQADAAYNEFFQETGDGNISIGRRAQKSWLEIATTILGYVIPLLLIATAFWSFHVYIQRGGWAQAIKDNYSFLCPYLNYSISLSDEYREKFHCETLLNIKNTFNKMNSDLESQIVEKLNEYIPIKLTKNILATSPEKKFAEETYKQKLHMDVVMNKFEEVRNNSKSLIAGNNIVCNGLSVSGKWDISTQCSIYGDVSGKDDENGNLWSARIEALRFIANLADTSKSQFILINPPATLSMEKISDSKEFSNFHTRTTISIQAKYVPFQDKN